MELSYVINQRRSVRKFKETLVEENKIKEILNSARLAPSAKNRQPWRFYYCSVREKDKIAEMMRNWHDNNANNHTSLLGTSVAIKQAPVLILVFRKIETQWERSDILSIGGAIENMLLTATNLGLGSLWIADTWYIKEEISNFLNINLELYSAVCIGYADEIPKEISRKSLTEIMLN